MKYLGSIQAMLGLAITAGFFSTLWFVKGLDVASSMRDAVLILIGSLGAAFGAVVNFYFGSSSGSQLKDRIREGNPTP
jgi:hypothetical protein